MSLFNGWILHLWRMEIILRATFRIIFLFILVWFVLLLLKLLQLKNNRYYFLIELKIYMPLKFVFAEQEKILKYFLFPRYLFQMIHHSELNSNNPNEESKMLHFFPQIISSSIFCSSKNGQVFYYHHFICDEGFFSFNVTFVFIISIVIVQHYMVHFLCCYEKSLFTLICIKWINKSILQNRQE